MNYLKNLLGIKKSQLQTLINAIGKVPIQLYQISNSKRIKKLNNAQITITKIDNKYHIHIQNLDNQQQQFNFPIHNSMNLVCFPLGTQKYCFQWQLEQEQKEPIIGIKVKRQYHDNTKKLLCFTIVEALGQKQQIIDPLILCKKLDGIPNYQKQNVQYQKNKQDLTPIMIKETNKSSTKLVNSGKLFVTINQVRIMKNEAVVFVVGSKGNFQYQIYLLDNQGKRICQKQINQSMNYQVNVKNILIKWLDVDTMPASIVQVTFQKFDVALSIKFVMQQCLYEIRTKQIMKDNIQSKDIEYLQSIEHQPEPRQNSIVNFYKGPQKLQLDPQKTHDYQLNGIEKYEGKRIIAQSKKNNFMLLSLANQLQTLTINQNYQFKRLNVKTIQTDKKDPVIPDKILFHQCDKMAMIKDRQGGLYYYDIELGKIIDQYKQISVKDIAPQKKLAQIKDYQTFVGIDKKGIYRLDMRIDKKQRIVDSKIYSTEPNFNNVTTNTSGNVAVGSEDGQIRLYKGVNKNANTKYPGLGDPVLHLESTKDNKWLLATYKKYLILLPTFEGNIDFYEQKTKIQVRPKPVKLTIKFDHLAICKINDLKLLPAKFDETSSEVQRFIVSGFADYVVIWSVSAICKGNTQYTFSKVEQNLDLAEFRFEDPSRLIMSTKNRLKVQESKI